MEEIEEASENLSFNNQESCGQEIQSLKEKIKQSQESLQKLNQEAQDFEKIIMLAEKETENSQKIKSQVSELDTCPLCQSKMTKSHIDHVTNSSDEKINQAQESLNESKQSLEKIGKNKISITDSLNQVTANFSFSTRFFR